MPGLVQLVPTLGISELDKLQNPLGLTGPGCGNEATRGGGGGSHASRRGSGWAHPGRRIRWKQQHGVITPTARGLSEGFMPNRIRGAGVGAAAQDPRPTHWPPPHQQAGRVWPLLCL